MDYFSIYNRIISNAVEREVPDEYYEWHHIVPKCLGGYDSIDNKVRLTFREHYFVHLLLVKIYKEYPNLIFAVEGFYCRTRKVHKDIKNMPKWVRRKIHLTRYWLKINP